MVTLRARSFLRAFAKQPGLAMRLAALRFLESLRHRPAREALRSTWRATLRACPTTDTLWQALLAERDGAVHALIAEVVALDVVDGDAVDGPPALLGQLAETLGLERVEGFELTEEWLDAYHRRDQLLDLGLACGALQETVLEEFEGLSLPALRLAILSSETRDPAWLPPELYFTTAPRKGETKPSHTPDA